MAQTIWIVILFALAALTSSTNPRFLVFFDWDCTLGPFDPDQAWEKYDRALSSSTRHERIGMRPEAKEKIDEILQRLINSLKGQVFVLTAGRVENLEPGGNINKIEESLIPREHILTIAETQGSDCIELIPKLKMDHILQKAKDLHVPLNHVYFVDDNMENVEMARHYRVNTIKVRQEEISASFERNGESYGDPESGNFFQHLDRTWKMIAAFENERLTVNTLTSLPSMHSYGRASERSASFADERRSYESPLLKSEPSRRYTDMESVDLDSSPLPRLPCIQDTDTESIPLPRWASDTPVTPRGPEIQPLKTHRNRLCAASIRDLQHQLIPPEPAELRDSFRSNEGRPTFQARKAIFDKDQTNHSGLMSQTPFRSAQAPNMVLKLPTPEDFRKRRFVRAQSAQLKM